jgi:hypothetical protein
MRERGGGGKEVGRGEGRGWWGGRGKLVTNVSVQLNVLRVLTLGCVV